MSVCVFLNTINNIHSIYVGTHIHSTIMLETLINMCVCVKVSNNLSFCLDVRAEKQKFS